MRHWLASVSVSLAILSIGGCGTRPSTRRIPAHLVLDRRATVVLHTHRDDPLGQASSVVVWNGRIAIADAMDVNVKVFSRGGVLIRVFGRAGDGPGEFRDPFALSPLPNGDLAVLDGRTMLVTVFDSVGTYQGRWRARGYFPGGISYVPDVGRVLVLARHLQNPGRDESTVLEAGLYTPDGRLVRSGLPFLPSSNRWERSYQTTMATVVHDTLIAVQFGSTDIRLWDMEQDSVLDTPLAPMLWQPPRWPGNQVRMSDGQIKAWDAQQTWITGLWVVQDSLTMLRLQRKVHNEVRYAYLFARRSGKGLCVTSMSSERVDIVRADTAWGVRIRDDGVAVLDTYLLSPQHCGTV